MHWGALTVSANAVGGTFGDNLTWTLNTDTGVLEISGKGGMPNNSHPWIGSRTDIQTVNISDGVTSIGNSAFFSHESLTSVTIPDSVTSIGNSVFGGCTSLESINVDINNLSYMSESGILYNKGKSRLICYPAGKTESEFVIPDSVTSIGDSAFSSCGRLTSVTIPDSVTEIGFLAFSYCTNLYDIYFLSSNPPTVDSISFVNVKLGVRAIIPDGATAYGKEWSKWDGLIIVYYSNKDEDPPTGGIINYNIEKIIIEGVSSGLYGNVVRGDFVINLTTETFTRPSDYTIKSFSIDGGKKWKKAKPNTFTEERFPKLLNKDLELVISDKDIDRKSKPKQPEEGDNRITFDKINKKPKAPKLKVNYTIIPEQWVLVANKNDTKILPEFGKIQVGLASGKKVDSYGYGKFFSDGSIATTATKTTYFVRYEPKKDGDVYTAASKHRKISVKAPRKK